MSSSDWFDRDDSANPPPNGPDRFGGPGGAGGPDGPPAGGGRPPRSGGQGGQPGRRSRLGPTTLILSVLALTSGIAAQLLTDYWWYDSLGYRGVMVTEIGTKVALFAVAALITALAVGVSLWAGYRFRPLRIPTTQSELVLEQYRLALEPLRRIGLIGIPAVLGVLAGAGAMGAWRTWLLWRHSQPFGSVDPQFGRDLGFFVFTLPWWRFLVSFFTVVLVLALLAGLFSHYVYGGLQLPGRGPTSGAAYVQLGIAGALLVLVRGAGYWLDRYSLVNNTSQLGSASGSFTGLTWTAANAVMPTKAILAIAAVICALLWLAAIFTRSWRLPLLGVALLAVVAVVVGTIYPALIQSLKVRPSEQSLEAPFIKRNIDATRAAFGLDAVKVQNFQGSTVASPEVTAAATAATKDVDAIPGIRLNDPNVVAQTFQQKQAQRPYYTFPDRLDVDRYTIDGKLRDAVVAVREITTEGVPTRNWINDHTVYTHGYGFYAAYGNRVTGEGDPVLFSSGDPESSTLGKVEQRIYFGEMSPTYSIVGAPAGAAPREVDYPDSQSGGEKNNTYDGSGGVAIGSNVRQFVYAVKYREPKFLLSDVLNSESRLLDHRSPLERVQRVAPWLTLDDNVYPAVVDGRIQWIVEGFTTTRNYPNSQLTDLNIATSETTDVARPSIGGVGEVNYIRNSVKATVDAFDGSVVLYAWDAKDPLLKAWSEAFSGTVQPMSKISGALMSHLRYPADLLKIQRTLYTRYHVTEPGAFYTAQDNWRIPKDPAHPDVRDQPVYYQSIQMPGSKAPAFSVTTTFVPSSSQNEGKENLRAFLSVAADAGSAAGSISPGYGSMRALVLPGDSSVLGPGLVENRIEASNERSQNPTETLNLRSWINNSKQSGGQLTYGNLLTLPLGDGLLYVQPLFIQTSKSAGSFPQMKAVVTMFGDRVSWGSTLAQAVSGLFGVAPGTPGTTPGAPGTGTTPPATGTAAEQLAQALADIDKAYAAGQEALKKGDFTAYGEAQKQLAAALNRAKAIAPQVTGQAVPSPTPSPAASPSQAP